MAMGGLVAGVNAQNVDGVPFASRGANGLFEEGNFESYYRDVRIGTLHAVSTPDVV